MTLNDLLLLIKHYLRWVIVVPIACAVALGGFSVARDLTKSADYSAMATLTVVDPSNSLSASSLSYLLNATAQRVAADSSDEGVAVSVKPDDKTQSVSITAVASSSEGAEEAANWVAEETSSAVRQTLLGQAEAFRREMAADGASSSGTGEDVIGSKAVALESCVFSIVPASVASDNDASSALKFSVVGLFGGLFIVLVGLIVLNMVKGPIKSKDDVSAVTDLPVLNGRGGPASSEIVCANLLDLSNGKLRSVDVVADRGNCSDFANLLQASFDAISDTEVDVKALSFPDQSADVYTKARYADAVIIRVTKWRSSAADLSCCIEELILAKANVVGIVLL